MEIPADVRMAFLRENVPFRRKITRKDAAGDILQHLFFRIIHKALRGRWFRFRKITRSPAPLGREFRYTQ